MAVYSISIRELRPKLPEVVADTAENMSRYVITKRGKPAAVILNKDEYDSMMETLGLQSNITLMKEIAQAETSFKKRKNRRLKDIRRGL